MISPIVQFKSFWTEVPCEVQKFLIRALVIFLVWKFAYHLVLKPTRVIDKPLTQINGIFTMKGLSWIYTNNNFKTVDEMPRNSIDFFATIIYKNDRKIIGIGDPCNGLELYILYIAFIISLPASILRILTFSITGFLIIFLMNIVRCIFIANLNLNKNIYTDVAHHYIFKLLMYSLIFGGWVFYSKNNKIEL